MNPLQSRKKMLIAESELNRAQLVRDWQTMADDVHALTKQARTIGALASAAASLVTGLLSFRHKTPVPVDEKPSWLQKILKGAQLAGSLWTEFRSPKK
jgi:HPt (histidine-containing phosphotransfer) domain-containing protein